MATYGVGQPVFYRARVAATGLLLSGDVANHTIRWLKDGVTTTPTNAPTEPDATHCPGVYAVVLIDSEAECVTGIPAGKSSTSGIVIEGLPVDFHAVLGRLASMLEASP